MKDLIAKLQMDANCAMGAIWLHIDAREARIAELEAELAKLRAGVQVVAEPVATVIKKGADRTWMSENLGKLPDGTYSLYTALLPASADKLREAILAIGHVADYCDPHKQFAYSSGFAAALKAAAELVASTAVQAPVREVPGWKMVPIEPTPEIVKAMAESQAVDDEGEFPSLHDLIDFSGENKTQAAIKAAYRAMISASPLPTMPVRDSWQPIETAPKDGTDILICKAWDASGNPMCENSHALFTQRAAWWAGENGGNGSWIVYNSMALDPECFFEPTHWMPVPSISVAAAPVQPDTDKD